MHNVFPPQDFKSMFYRFSTLSMEGLRWTFPIQINCNNEKIYEIFVKNLNKTIRLLTVFSMHFLDTGHHVGVSQLTLTCSKPTIETEKGVKYVQI